MSLLRTWLMGIVLTSFAVGLAGQTVPKGRGQSMVRLVGGVLILLAVVRPLNSFMWKDCVVEVGDFRGMLRESREKYSQTRENELCAIIAEKTETYIWDKAIELGMNCRVSVNVAARQNGIPVPDTVEIDGPCDPVLSAWIEEVVGIPAEKQIWQEGSVWTGMKERGESS